jgi:single-stranded-DNA-specific exonuclease
VPDDRDHSLPSTFVRPLALSAVDPYHISTADPAIIDKAVGLNLHTCLVRFSGSRMVTTPAAVFGIEQSLSGRTWRWRRGNMDLGTEQGLEHDLVTQLLLARGVAPDDVERQRNPSLRAFLPDPSEFRDMDVAAERLAQAVMSQESVTIYGDYDVDGATSAALLVLLLRQLDREARYYIPDRLLEGYGPSGEALVRLAEEGSSLIVTVDCGAMAHQALGMAHAAGVDVIVVDHHKCSANLPLTAALVNPNRLDESDLGAAHGHLAAVGVAFLLAIATVRTLRNRGYFAVRAEPDLLGLLDLVALGTVADVAALHGLNRAFVAQGLKVMARRENIGMAALIDASRLSRPPTCSDLGFALGPRINAGGRVGEATLGVRLLTTQDPDEARTIAAELSALNEERRAIEAAVQEAAEAQLASQHNRAVIVLAGKGWHPGVIGIVAGRIKEKTGKPTLVIALDADELGNGKGSGRSIAGVDLGAAIIAAREANLLIAGGGHAMAAGLTISASRVDALGEWLDARLGASVAAAMGNQSMLLDLSLAPRGLTPALVEALESAGPYGVGWPGPRVAVGPVRLVKADVVGNDHLRLIVSGEDGGSFKAIAFRAATSEMGQALLAYGRERRLWLAGRAKIDDWASRPQAELHLEDAAWAD